MTHRIMTSHSITIRIVGKDHPRQIITAIIVITVTAAVTSERNRKIGPKTSVTIVTSLVTTRDTVHQFGKSARTAVNQVATVPSPTALAPPSELPMLKGRINDHEITCLVNSGSALSYVSDRIIQQLDTPTCALTAAEATLPGGRRVPISEETILPVTLHENLVQQLHLRVFPNLEYDLILGKDWLSEHNPSIDWSRNIVRLGSGRHATKLPRPSFATQSHATL